MGGGGGGGGGATATFCDSQAASRVASAAAARRLDLRSVMACVPSRLIMVLITAKAYAGIGRKRGPNQVS